MSVGPGSISLEGFNVSSAGTSFKSINTSQANYKHHYCKFVWHKIVKNVLNKISSENIAIMTQSHPWKSNIYGFQAPPPE